MNDGRGGSLRSGRGGRNVRRRHLRPRRARGPPGGSAGAPGRSLAAKAASAPALRLAVAPAPLASALSAPRRIAWQRPLALAAFLAGIAAGGGAVSLLLVPASASAPGRSSPSPPPCPSCRTKAARPACRTPRPGRRWRRGWRRWSTLPPVDALAAVPRSLATLMLPIVSKVRVEAARRPPAGWTLAATTAGASITRVVARSRAARRAARFRTIFPRPSPRRRRRGRIGRVGRPTAWTGPTAPHAEPAGASPRAVRPAGQARRGRSTPPPRRA